MIGKAVKIFKSIFKNSFYSFIVCFFKSIDLKDSLKKKKNIKHLQCD